jgi:hypothetical protein
MADYTVVLHVDGHIDDRRWEFEQGAYPKRTKTGLVEVEVSVDATSEDEAKNKGVSALETKIPALKGKVEAVRAWRPTTTKKYT